jgi:hypothetical protein
MSGQGYGQWLSESGFIPVIMQAARHQWRMCKNMLHRLSLRRMISAWASWQASLHSSKQKENRAATCLVRLRHHRLSAVMVAWLETALFAKRVDTDILQRSAFRCSQVGLSCHPTCIVSTCTNTLHPKVQGRFAFMPKDT